MKQTITTLALLAAVSANAYAQNLQGEWTDGTIVYYAKTDNNGAEYTFDGFLGDDSTSRNPPTTKAHVTFTTPKNTH